MKKLIFVLFVVLSACSEERVAPSFDSLEGWWTFSSKEVSGGFEVVEYSGDIVVDNGKGNSFEILGKEYPVLQKQGINGTLKLEIFLVNSSKTSVNFYEVEFNKGFTELTAKYWTYWQDGVFTQVNTPITITR